MEFEWFYGHDTAWPAALGVRVEVFVDEQGFSPESEIETLDESCWHILAGDENGPAATARLFPQGAQGEWHIGRVAVCKAHRGKGLGRLLMQQAIDKAKELGATCLVLGAQQDKAGFYESLGFRTTGNTYDDEGCPHVYMTLSL